LSASPEGAAAAEQHRILIIEDHELLGHSVGLVLSNEGYDVTLSRLSSMSDVIREAAELRPHVVLLDLDLGDSVGDGVGLVQPLCGTGARVLVLTAATEPHRLGLCLEAGAVGVLNKRFSLDELIAAVRSSVDGEAPTAEPVRAELLKALRVWRSKQGQLFAPFERLTPRERQVLACMLEGRSAESIAKEWVVSEATVRTQIRGVLTKLGVSSQLAAVALARRASWELEAAG
jgi:DNA-binding NarL/FixJ family response regulator